MRAAGYTRVSTDRQADHGVSLEAQRTKIAAMAVVQGAELVELIEDGGASAKDLNRPGMTRLLELVNRRAVDMVIIAKLDRLTRNVRDLADLLALFDKRKVALVSIADSLDTKTAAGRLVINLMASVSQWEREVIGERTAEALALKRAKGERISRHVPFGYQLAADGVHLERNAQEQGVLARIAELRGAGYTLRAIAAELNRQGYVTRRGSPWRHEYVANLVKAA